VEPRRAGQRIHHEKLTMRSDPVAVIGMTLLLAVVSLSKGVGQVTSPEGTPRATVTVEATHPWVDSGLTVRKGERLSFEVSGSIRWGSKPDQVAGPEGHGAKAGKVGVGGLIGRVGFTGKPFPIGSTRTPMTMSQSGKLFLGINDFIFKDNAGSFVVKILPPGV
jgi:hypothetical protein